MGGIDTLRERHSLSRLRSDLFACIRLSLLIAASFALLSRLPSDAYLLDLISHFQLQYFLALLLGLLIGWRAVSRYLRIYLLLGLTSTLLMLAQMYLPPENCQDCVLEQSASLKLAFANVRTRNSNYEALMDAVAEDTEVLGLIEIDTMWVEGLEKLKQRFPYHFAHPRPDNFGLILFSRYPIQDARLINTPEVRKAGLPPTLVASLELPGGTSTLILTHPVPPQTAELFAQRNKQLQILSALIAGLEGPVLLLGDLNTTPWSYSMKRFLSDSGLKDARQGFGLLPSWPNQIFPLLIPLDYCLIDEHFSVRDVATISVKGSDHRGLRIELMRRKSINESSGD